MYKHTPDVIKTLEIICSQAVLNEDYEPEYFSIHKQDIEHQDISYHTMKSCVNTLVSKKYLQAVSFVRLYLPHEEIDSFGTDGIKRRVQDIPDMTATTDSGEKVVIKKGGFFIGDEMANGLITDDIWSILTKLKEGASINEITSEYLTFNETESILKIDTHLIPISKRMNRSNPHYLLTHIFETDKEEEYSFEHLANISVISDKPEQYHNACKDLNKIITKKTNNGVPDFLEFDSKHVRVNRKYIKE